MTDHPYRKWGISQVVWERAVAAADALIGETIFPDAEAVAEAVLDAVFLSGEPPAIEGVDRALRRARQP